MRRTRLPPHSAATSTHLLLALATLLCGGPWGPLGPSQHTCATAQELPWFTADVTVYSVSGVFYSVQHCPVLLNEVLLSEEHRPQRAVCDVTGTGGALSASITFTSSAGVRDLLQRASSSGLWDAVAAQLQPACGWGASLVAMSGGAMTDLRVCTAPGAFAPNSPYGTTGSGTTCTASLLRPAEACASPPPARVIKAG